MKDPPPARDTKSTRFTSAFGTTAAEAEEPDVESEDLREGAADIGGFLSPLASASSSPSVPASDQLLFCHVGSFGFEARDASEIESEAAEGSEEEVKGSD